MQSVCYLVTKYIIKVYQPYLCVIAFFKNGVSAYPILVSVSELHSLPGTRVVGKCSNAQLLLSNPITQTYPIAMLLQWLDVTTGLTFGVCPYCGYSDSRGAFRRLPLPRVLEEQQITLQITSSILLPDQSSASLSPFLPPASFHLVPNCTKQRYFRYAIMEMGSSSCGKKKSNRGGRYL